MATFRRLALTLAAVAGIGTFAVPQLAHADGTHVVVPGDTLSGIAASSGVRLSDLLRANGLQISSLILPGQHLDIPGTSAGTSPVGTPTPSPSASNQAGANHVVQWGDTLSGIARRNGVSLSSLLGANQLSLTSMILPGMSLRVPGGTSATASPSTSASPSPSASPSSTSGSDSTYSVRAGDTLSGIAARHRVSLEALLRTNSMSTTSLILPGMRLMLPSGSTPAVATPTPTPTSTPTSTPASTGVDAVVGYALAQVGTPYRFFAKGPDAFDCSGLTLAAYAAIGVDLVHYSAAQARQGTAVDFRNEPIRPGDLVFQARRGSDTINHVGMAITSTTWIQAVGTGHTVRVGSMPSLDSIDSVRRIID